MERSRKRTYVSATLDIFIQCRSNWVFKKRIWKRQSTITRRIFTWACEWSVLNINSHCEAVENQIHTIARTHLFLYVLSGVLAALLYTGCVYRTLSLCVIHYPIHRLWDRDKDGYNTIICLIHTVHTLIPHQYLFHPLRILQAATLPDVHLCSVDTPRLWITNTCKYSYKKLI